MAFQFRVIFFVLMAVFAGLVSMQAGAEAFPPEKTWVFVAGLLKWEDPENFASFPQENRQDSRLVAFFREKGVPPGQLTYLRDKAATLQRVKANFQKFVEKIPADGVLLFYYCGHGYQDDDAGKPLFAPWDASEKGGWPMADVVDVVFDSFKGKRALLLADCCQSGALVRQVRKRNQEGDAPRVAAVSSSSARETSTGNWTFTESFLDALEGRIWVDRAADGEVTLRDFAAHAVEEMRVFENQRASSEIPGNWPADAILSSVQGARKERVGERVEALAEGKYWPGRIIDGRNGEFLVRYVGYFAEDDHWHPPKELRPMAAGKRIAIGTAAEVKWKGAWYPGKILDDDGGAYLVSYDGYDAKWNEWAAPDRVRTRRLGQPFRSGR